MRARSRPVAQTWLDEMKSPFQSISSVVCTAPILCSNFSYGKRWKRLSSFIASRSARIAISVSLLAYLNRVPGFTSSEFFAAMSMTRAPAKYSLSVREPLSPLSRPLAMCSRLRTVMARRGSAPLFQSAITAG